MSEIAAYACSSSDASRRCTTDIRHYTKEGDTSVESQATTSGVYIVNASLDFPVTFTIDGEYSYTVEAGQKRELPWKPVQNVTAHVTEQGLLSLPLIATASATQSSTWVGNREGSLLQAFTDGVWTHYVVRTVQHPTQAPVTYQPQYQYEQHVQVPVTYQPQYQYEHPSTPYYYYQHPPLPVQYQHPHPPVQYQHPPLPVHYQHSPVAQYQHPLMSYQSRPQYQPKLQHQHPPVTQYLSVYRPQYPTSYQPQYRPVVRHAARPQGWYPQAPAATCASITADTQESWCSRDGAAVQQFGDVQTCKSFFKGCKTDFTLSGGHDDNVS